MAKKRRGLGSLGVDALLSPQPPTSSINQNLASSLQQATQSKDFAYVGVECIRPNRYQPRQHMDEDALAELAASIQRQGLIQPLLVSPLPDDNSAVPKYELVAGERRWRAAQRIGLERVPVVIRLLEDRELAVLALVENVQREDLRPLEKALALKNATTAFKLTHEDVAAMVGCSRSAVSNLIRLLDLDSAVLELLKQGSLEEGHARVLLRLPQKEQALAANKIVSETLSVRKTEAYVSSLLNTHSGENSNTKPALSADTIALEQKLEKHFGSPVKLKHRPSGSGNLVVRYADLDVLDGILKKIFD